MVKPWAGRRVRTLVNIVLSAKGRTCHICGRGGADSADHDPPRSHLIRAGVTDPDQLVYLFPAHRVPCNVGRRDRTLTPTLRAALTRARIIHETSHPPFFENRSHSRKYTFQSPPRVPEKNGDSGG